MRSKPLKFPWKKIKSRNIVQRFLDRLWNIFISEPIWFVKQKCRAFKRFIEYGKIGWKSYDWDYSYLLILLRFKLQRMKKVLEYGNCIPEKQGLQSIKICLRLLDRLITDNYNYWKNKHYDKWGQPEFDFVEDSEDEELGKLFAMIDKRHNSMNQEELEQEREEYMVAIKKDEEHTQRDSRLLFSIMNKYYTWWWD